MGPAHCNGGPRRIRGYGIEPAHCNGGPEVYGVRPAHCNGRPEVCGLGPAHCNGGHEVMVPDPRTVLRSRRGLKVCGVGPARCNWGPEEDLRFMVRNPCAVKLELKHGHENRGTLQALSSPNMFDPGFGFTDVVWFCRPIVVPALWSSLVVLSYFCIHTWCYT